MIIVIDIEIIELFRIQWWHLQCKFGIKVFNLLCVKNINKSAIQSFIQKILLLFLYFRTFPNTLTY